jgi:hypothetical protein
MGKYRVKQNNRAPSLIERMGHDRQEAACASQSLIYVGFAKAVRRSKADSSLICLLTSGTRNGCTS